MKLSLLALLVCLSGLSWVQPADSLSATRFRSRRILSRPNSDRDNSWDISTGDTDLSFGDDLSGGLDWSVDIGSQEEPSSSAEAANRGQVNQGFTLKKLFGDRNDDPLPAYPLEAAEGLASSVDNSSMLKSDSGVPQAPQRVRLRGDRADMNPNEGRVEVFYKGRWGLVCDDHFGQAEANVACQSLGFKHGASRPYMSSFFGKGGYTSKDILLERLRCSGSGNEAGLHECSHSHLGRCSANSTAGVECTYNDGCELGWIAFDGLCYRVEASSPKTPDEAAEVCSEQGASLAYVLSETENNFISNVLYTKYRNIKAAWVAGRYARIERQRRRSSTRRQNQQQGSVTELEETWIFKDSLHVISEDKSMWFPGFAYSQRSMRPQNAEKKSCLALSKIFYDRRTRRDTEVNYFWWDNVSCRTELPFVCQKLAQTSDCYNGTGLDYLGDAMRTEDGSLCQKWGADNPDWQIRSGGRGSRGRSRGRSFGRSGRIGGSLGSSSSSSYSYSSSSSSSYSYSSSSSSSYSYSSSSSSSGGSVTEHTFQRWGRGYRDDHNYCRNPDRDRKPWCWLDKQIGIYGYCNIQHCNSSSAATSAPPAIGSQLPNASFNSPMCNRPDKFFCPSMINYRPTCVRRSDVCDGVQDCIGGEDESADFCRSYKCQAEEFYCSRSHRCIPMRRVCDGISDCDFGDDERAEACQIYRPENNSTDVSMDLDGYRKTENIANPEFPDTISVTIYLSLTLLECKSRCDRWDTMSIKCAGFTFKQRAEYGISECNLLSDRLTEVTIGEGSTLTYYEKEQTCDASTHRKCTNGNCVANELVCNGFDDCGDFSDEIGPAACPSPKPTFSVRLGGGKGAYEGRIEVQLFKEWGLVCDDGLDPGLGNLVCRSLGFDQGYEQLVFNARRQFGQGAGPFLMNSVNCNVSSSSSSSSNMSLYDCAHAGWKKGSCSINNIAGLVCRRDRACTNQEMRCSSRCVPLTAVCNGVADCPDGSDEVACGTMSLRLRASNGSTERSSGFLEIVRGNIAGAICDDHFGDKEVQVACRHLGFTTGLGQKMPPGTLDVPRNLVMWANNAACLGTESSLFDCNITNWGSSHCDLTEAVAIQCGVQPTTPAPTTAPPRPPTTARPTEGAAATTTSAAACGKRFGRFPMGRIVNGYQAISGQYPWQVGIRVRVSSTQSAAWCGGTIINDRWIVSAAHCFTNYKKSSYVLRIGDLDNTVRDAEEREFDVDLLISHEGYTGSPRFDYDIALLRIKPDRLGYISFSNTVQPACLPDKTLVPPTGIECFISGWGATASGGTGRDPNNLLAAKVPLIDHSRCNELYDGRITQRMLCAGFEAGGIDSCQGDSGGPLVCSIDGSFVLVGATSWGEGCAVAGKPGVYAHVTNLRGWIDQTIAENP